MDGILIGVGVTIYLWLAWVLIKPEKKHERGGYEIFSRRTRAPWPLVVLGAVASLIFVWLLFGKA